MATGLYDPSVDDLIRSTFRNVWSVAALNVTDNVTIPLDVAECEITLDEFWSPYVQGTLRGVVPATQALLDALDARKVVRFTVNAGYVLANGAQNVQPLARAYLTNRVVQRPDDDLQLSLQGKEYLFDGWQPLYDQAGWVQNLNQATWTSTTPARDAVTRALIAAGAITGSDVPAWDGSDPSWDYAGALATTGWSTDSPPWIPVNEPAMDVSRDIADRVGGWFRCDETGVWRLTARPVVAGTSSAVLTVGASGTVLSSQTGLSRDGWGNAVRVTYTWSGGTAEGWASTTSGPYAVAAVGQATIVQDYPWQGSNAAAQARAANILRRSLSRGRSITLDAVAAYWLRPGQTVTVQLPLGPQERHLVSAVTYRLHEGSMTVTTRVPDNSTISGGS